MKIFKAAILVLGLFAFSQVNAQKANKKKQKLFEAIDKNSNGSISKSEFKKANKGKTDKTGNKINYKEIFAKLDTNNDNKISFEEFPAKIKKGKKKGKKNKS